MKDAWQNNKISKKLNEDYPHDFSICDIDGVCRCFYKQNNTWKQRLVIYESKHHNEIATQTQLGTLHALDISIKWENFDEKSGVFLLRHDDEIENIDVYKIKDAGGFKYILDKIGSTTMDKFYKWISAKDRRK